MVNARYFNQRGREKWTSLIQDLRSDPGLPFSSEILTDTTFSSAAPGGVILPEASNSKFDLACDLASKVAVIEEAGLQADRWPGLWDWLAAYYLDVICPVQGNGKRKIGKDLARYQYDSDFRRYYRHRIYGPVSKVRMLGDSAKILLHGSPDSLTDWEEQAAARVETSGNPGIAEALFKLYWDEEAAKPKRGAAPNSKKRGTLRRFGDIVKQLTLTYDLNAIKADDFLELLPAEFDRWKSQ